MMSAYETELANGPSFNQEISLEHSKVLHTTFVDKYDYCKHKFIGMISCTTSQETIATRKTQAQAQRQAFEVYQRRLEYLKNGGDDSFHSRVSNDSIFPRMSNDSLPRSSSETELAFNDVANILLRPRSTRVSKDSRYSVKPPLPLTELHRISGKNSIVSTSSSFEKQRQQSDLYKNLAPYLLTVLTYDNVIHGSLVRKEMASGRSRSLGQRVVARLRHSIGAKLSSKTGSSENGKACTIAVTGKKMYVFDVPRSENGVFVAGPVTAEGEPVLLDSVGGSEVAMKRWSALLLKYEYPNAHLRQRADIVVDIIDVCIYAEKDALLQVIGREISGDSRVLFMQGTEIGEVERWLHIFERVANMKIAE